MKNKLYLCLLILPLLAVLGITSCKKNDQAGGTGAPTIGRVRLLSKTDTIKNVVHRITLDSNSVYDDRRVVPFDSTVTSGKLGNQYGIVGTNLLTTSQVLFNGVPAYFNSALLTDNLIIITIPTNIPFGPSQINKLTIITAYGRIDYTFGIQQPPASITGFTPLAGSTGDTVTITGTVFDGVTGVTFDKIPATIVGTPTKTQIKVKVPAGVVQAYIYVTTPGGTAKSPASYGFKSLVYDDSFTNGWGSYFGYNSTRDYANTEHPKRGPYAIKVIYSNNYGALQVGYNGSTLDVAKLGLTSIKFSIYGGAGFAVGQKVQVILNGNYSAAVQVTVVPGVYTDFTVPISSLGSPATINELVIQGANVPVPSTIYVDDIGFI
jgi:hypothetical protein